MLPPVMYQHSSSSCLARQYKLWRWAGSSCQQQAGSWLQQSAERARAQGGGHYKAVCRAAAPGGGEAWLEFDDALVRRLGAKAVAADYLTSAYIFCFVRKVPAS